MSAANQSALTDSLEALLQSIWNDETYRPFYDEAYCLNQNVTFSNRVDAEGAAGRALWDGRNSCR